MLLRVQNLDPHQQKWPKMLSRVQFLDPRRHSICVKREGREKGYGENRWKEKEGRGKKEKGKEEKEGGEEKETGRREKGWMGKQKGKREGKKTTSAGGEPPALVGF
jgi:hypothetical protein